MKKLTSTLFAASFLGLVGCSTESLPSPKYKEPKQNIQYSLENILPDKYKSMKLEYIGSVKRGFTRNNSRIDEKEFVVTVLYQDRNRKLSPKEREARERTEGNIAGKIAVADYSIMIVYQVCDGDANNKKPVLMFAPHDGEEGSSWMFYQHTDSKGKFNSWEDLLIRLEATKNIEEAKKRSSSSITNIC